MRSFLLACCCSLVSARLLLEAVAPPPPIAELSVADTGEVIALDIPLAVYDARHTIFNDAFSDALRSVTGNQVTVIGTKPSSVNTTCVYFEVILPGTDYAAIASAWSLARLFSQEPDHGFWTVGAPALPVLTKALTAAGLPIAGAFWRDQITPSRYAPVPPAEVDPGRIGTWRYALYGESIAIDVPFMPFARHELQYAAAFEAGVASAMGVARGAVSVSDFQPTPAGTTRVVFSVGVPSATSSEALPAAAARVAALFEGCGGKAGCPAGRGSALVRPRGGGAAGDECLFWRTIPRVKLASTFQTYK